MTHSLVAFTRAKDFIPTLYVVGQIKAKGELVGIHLEEVNWSEAKENTLVLKFVPDDYDPKGPTHVRITNFDKILAGKHYEKVIIQSKQGNIELIVEHVPRSSNLLSGGGGEAPRG